MTEIIPYLFVYGTLMSREMEPAAALMQGCSFFCKGKFTGKLYDLGEYPGAVLSAQGQDGYVYGDVIFMEAPQMSLTLLDDYEGYGDDQEQPNLFVRKLIEVDTANGTMACWVYLYNSPVEGFKQIISGKFLNS